VKRRPRNTAGTRNIQPGISRYEIEFLITRIIEYDTAQVNRLRRFEWHKNGTRDNDMTDLTEAVAPDVLSERGYRRFLKGGADGFGRDPGKAAESVTDLRS
jgi:hypothetical protein